MSALNKNGRQMKDYNGMQRERERATPSTVVLPRSPSLSRCPWTPHHWHEPGLRRHRYKCRKTTEETAAFLRLRLHSPFLELTHLPLSFSDSSSSSPAPWPCSCTLSESAPRPRINRTVTQGNSTHTHTDVSANPETKHTEGGKENSSGIHRPKHEWERCL